jgi:hypothetical protein
MRWEIYWTSELGIREWCWGGGEGGGGARTPWFFARVEDVKGSIWEHNRKTGIIGIKRKKKHFGTIIIESLLWSSMHSRSTRALKLMQLWDISAACPVLCMRQKEPRDLVPIGVNVDPAVPIQVGQRTDHWRTIAFLSLMHEIIISKKVTENV